jgi:L-ascorbate metabolism protein UlaG (beta-lactamase superfamily)
LIGKNIDIAFIPVDPRLEENYDLSAKYFANKINAQVIIPMHFRDALSYLKTLDQNWLDIETSSRFQLISREGQSFFYDFNY